jgi:hypothetical protein
VKVSSSIIPEKFNVLLNPSYPAYETLVWAQARSFQFDPRLFISEPRML